MYTEKPKNTALKVTSGIVVIIAVVLVSIAASVSASEKKQQALAGTSTSTSVAVTPATSSTTTAPATTTPSTSTSANTSSYKDGTYSASNQYYVPHGYENIKVTITVKSGIVTDSSVVNSENNRESQVYQQDFASMYKSYVVGKNLDGLSLSYVAGASDTTNGFNNALTDIQNQAKA